MSLLTRTRSGVSSATSSTPTAPAASATPSAPTGSVPHRLRAFWHAEARRDNLPTWVADVVALTPIVGTVVLGLIYLVHRPAYYFVLREDMPVEWMQFACLLFVAGLAAITAARVRGRSWLLTGLLLVLALGAFGLAGEEISWGQRAFAWGTPAELAAMNMQAETNIHNVQVAGLPVQQAFKLVSFLLAVAGLALAWFTRAPRPRLRGRFWETVSAPTYTMVGSATMVVYWAAVIVAPVSPVVRYQEWAEACLYLSLGALVLAISTRVNVMAGSGPISGGRPVRAAPDRAGIIMLVVVLTVTVVLAALSAHHGIVPLNNPEALKG